MVERDGMLVVERSELIFENENWTMIWELLVTAFVLASVTWYYLIRRFFLFLVIVTWHFYIWKLFLFLVGFYKSKSILFFRLILSIFIAVEGSFSGREPRWQPLCYKQSPAFTQNSQKKDFLFLQIHMKNTWFVKTTASPITTIRRVFYPLVNTI